MRTGVGTPLGSATARKMLKESKQSITKTNKNKQNKQMKKHYKEPVIDLVELEVEQGIAQSLMTGGEFFHFDEESGFDDDNIVDFEW